MLKKLQNFCQFLKSLIVILFLFGTFAVFISALKHSLDVSFGSNIDVITDPRRISYLDKIIVFSCIAVLLILGLWIPEPFAALLKTASEIIQNGVRL